MNTYDLTEVYVIVGDVKLQEQSLSADGLYDKLTTLASWQVDENEDQFNPFQQTE